MEGFIYKITNDINNKMYIGKTLHSIEKRFEEHLKDAQADNKKNRPLYKAIRKYGPEHFHIELIEKTDIHNLCDREVYWISFYNTYKEGYNATLGGDGRMLYDYDQLVEDYLNGSLIKEVAEHFGCDTAVVKQALNLANIDHFQNATKNTVKRLRCFDSKGFEKVFQSRTEAANWIMDTGRTATTNVDNIIAAIGRAANGQRKTAYKLQWENI